MCYLRPCQHIECWKVHLTASARAQLMMCCEARHEYVNRTGRFETFWSDATRGENGSGRAGSAYGLHEQ